MSVVAIDIGATSTKLGLVHEDCVSHFTRIATEPPLETFLARLHHEVKVLRQHHPQTASTGISVAGFLKADRSAMTYNPNLPWLENFPLAEQFQARLEVDSNAATLAEYVYGEGQSTKRFLCLTIGTGIGGGFMCDGELVRFAGECIGDVGHLIVEPGGALCTCGGRGCAEAVVRNNPEHAGRAIGILAASLAAVFLPDRIALSGGVCEANPSLLDAARAEFVQSAGEFARRNTQIVKARFGALSPLIGAACECLNGTR